MFTRCQRVEDSYISNHRFPRCWPFSSLLWSLIRIEKEIFPEYKDDDLNLLEVTWQEDYVQQLGNLSIKMNGSSHSLTQCLKRRQSLTQTQWVRDLMWRCTTSTRTSSPGSRSMTRRSSSSQRPPSISSGYLLFHSSPIDEHTLSKIGFNSITPMLIRSRWRDMPTSATRSARSERWRT